MSCLARWAGDPIGGTVCKTGCISHSVRGGGESLSSSAWATAASNRLLEFPRKWGRYQVINTISVSLMLKEKFCSLVENCCPFDVLYVCCFCCSHVHFVICGWITVGYATIRRFILGWAVLHMSQAKHVHVQVLCVNDSGINASFNFPDSN